MITKTKAYTSGDGKVHATIEAAQKAELEAIFIEIDREIGIDSGFASDHWTIPEICGAIIKRHDQFRDILATTENSRPRARKINKAKKLSNAGFHQKAIQSMDAGVDKPKKPSIYQKTQDILEAAKAEGIARQNSKYQVKQESGPMIDLVDLTKESA